MSLDSIAAAGPGDNNVVDARKKRKKKLSLDARPSELRYVTLPDGREIWRPNAPGIPDIPGEKS